MMTAPSELLRPTSKRSSRFRKLTGKTVSLDAVSSVPEVTLANTSEKPITEFILAVRNPESGTGRGFVQSGVAIAPGEVYVVRRHHFVAPERAMVTGENGETHSTMLQPKMDSGQYWLQFAQRSDMYLTVCRVTFNDGSASCLNAWQTRSG